jgi:hypothetical protein
VLVYLQIRAKIVGHQENDKVWGSGGSLSQDADLDARDDKNMRRKRREN